MEVGRAAQCHTLGIVNGTGGVAEAVRLARAASRS
jgi:hypothetical protein